MKWIRTFESFIDPNILSQLNIRAIVHSDYFFTDKTVGNFYTNNIFDITVNSMSSDHEVIYLYTTVKFQMVEYTIRISFDNERNVDYGGEYFDLKHRNRYDLDGFNKLTNEILDDLVPNDIWDVRFENN